MLETQLLREIEENGPLSQRQFMEKVLQAYYKNHIALGKDFTTAPEISQVFGELIGLWLLDMYQKLGSPEKIALVELGPGRGTLMADVLRIAKLAPAFWKALDVYLIEISPLLKDLQKKTISHPSIKWLEKIEDIPSSSTPLLVFANEFLDALPTAYYLRENNKLYERYVVAQDGKLSFQFKYLRQDSGPDTLWEESIAAENVMQSLCKRLKKQTGVFLCLDYGYEKGKGDTLQALFEGNPIDPFSHLGCADISCHVKFGHLKALVLKEDLKTWGPLPQGIFLKNLHIHERIEHLKQVNPTQRGSLEAACTRLTHPSQMGLLFKAFAVTFPMSLKPIGFDNES